jgi:hypothetical protein
MPTPTTYSSNLVFGGRIDSSLDKSVKQIENLLRQTNKETVAFQESISSIGTGLLAVGTAFLGLRTGLDMFEDLADKGAQLSDLTNKLKNNLAGFSSLKAPISEVVSQFDAFNVKLRQTSAYSTQITESFETAFTGKGYNPQVTMKMTSLLEQVEAGRREKLTPEQAEGTVSALDAAIKSGSQESVIELNRQLGLKLNPGALTGVPNTPGNPNVAYDAREAILERALKNVANPNAGLEARRDPRMAGYLFGQEQTEIAGKLGLGTNDLFAPVQQAMTKALRDFEGSGELEKFDVWSKDAGTRLSSFFQKFIEPKLPGALQKFEDILDKISDRIDKLTQGKDWFQDPKTEQHIHWNKILPTIARGLGWLGHSINSDAQNNLEQEKLGKVPSSSGMVSPTSIYDSVPAFAGGGIVTRPTIGLIGEKEPEGVFPLSFLGSDVKDITKANTEATKKTTDALTALTQKLDDNLSLLRQQAIFQQMPPQGGGTGGGGGSGGGSNLGSGTTGGRGVPYKPFSGTYGDNGVSRGKSLAWLPNAEGYRVGEEYDEKAAPGVREGHDSNYGPSGNKINTGEIGLGSQLAAKYGVHQGDYVQLTKGGWRRVTETSAQPWGIEYHAMYRGQFEHEGMERDTLTGQIRRGNQLINATKKSDLDSGGDTLSQTLDKAQQALKLGTNRLDDPRIKAKRASETVTPASTATEKTTPTVHYSPHVAVTVHGHGDVNTIETAVKRALAQHGEELGHHIRRTLQDEFRRDQRVNYA